MSKSKITVVGAGLAGCEAALTLAKAGYKIDLYEMRPYNMTPAHKTDMFAELVCSNSLKSDLKTTASGLFKAELDILDCQLLKIARDFSVPAGNALAVDRHAFAQKVTEIVKNHENINFINEEFCDFDMLSSLSFPEESYCIIACGPLISDKLTKSLTTVIGEENLYFFDAVAPIVSGDSIDFDKVFYQSRYNKEPLHNLSQQKGDYINCPFDKEDYIRFVNALSDGQKHDAKEFENEYFQNINFNFYENCVPIEELVHRGKDTLRFGVMKPMGLIDPRTNKRPYAVIQLRTENNEQTAFNLVGCQTMLKYPEQKRIFSMIPGLENAEFIRYGSIHRNTYLNTPIVCNPDFSLKKSPNIRIAGQIAGVEGYVESIFSGLLTAQIICKQIKSLPMETIAGQLWKYLTTSNCDFKPMNANFGLLPEIYMEKKNKSLKKELLSERSLKILKESYP